MRLRRLLWAWWLWAGIALYLAYHGAWGKASIFGVLSFLAHVTLPRELPPIYGLDHDFNVGSSEFLSSISGATGVPILEGNALQILNNGDEFYPAMLEAVESAEMSITIEAYIYWAESIGWRFAELLAEKARQGVSVKILLDAIGSASISEKLLTHLKAGGCEIAWFNPIHWYTFARFNNRTHRKSLIVDGRIAFTGGAGIADQWLGNAQDPKHWRDIQIRIEGPAVMALQGGFAQNWLATTAELVNGEAFYPQLDPAGSVCLQTVLSSPESGSSAVRIMYYLSIVCARRYIYIANPYFVPDPVALDILVDARRRGVDVKIMVSGKWNDSRLARMNSTRLYGGLLCCDVEMYEYERTMLHHKIMVVDDQWATVGTTNFDNRSFAHNEENNVCFYDRNAVAKLRDIFLEDLRACRRIDYESWKRRNLFVKSAEAVASILQDQV